MVPVHLQSVLAAAGCCVGVALLAGGVVSAQSQSPPIFRAGVELIQLDVVVTSADGRPVRGLQLEDFTLLDRGKPLAIQAVTEVAHARQRATAASNLPRDIASNQTATSDRLVVIVYDDLYFRASPEQGAALVRQVVGDLGDSASLALVTTSGKFGVEVTEDRSRILAAIDRHLVNGRRVVAPASIFTPLSTFRFVGNVAKMIGADDGRRKAFVWISSGIPDAALANSAVSSKAAVNKPTATRDLCDGKDWACTELARLLINLRRSGVAVYAVSPGVMTGPRSLDAIATETGGFSVNAHEPGAVARILDDLDNYYVLGFYPSDPKDRSYHVVDVQVNRPGVRVRARSGYQVDGTPAPPRNDSVLANLVGPVMPTTDLPLKLVAVPLLTGDRDAEVVTVLEVDLGDESDAPDTFAEEVDFAVFAVDLDKKRVVRSVARRVPVASARFRLQTILTLGPGNYQLRASATAARAGRAGSVYLFTDVPDPREPLIVTGVALHDPSAAAAEPLVVDRHEPDRATMALMPTFARQFAGGSVIDVAFQVGGRTASGASGVVSLIGDDGGVVASQPWTLAAGRRDVRLKLHVPASAAGVFRLAVSAASGEHVATTAIGVTISPLEKR